VLFLDLDGQVYMTCLSAPPHPVPGAVRKPLLYPYPHTLPNNYFNIVFHTCSLTDNGRYGIITAVLSSTLVVDAYILRAGMAQRRSTDVLYIPDCIESGDEAAQALGLQNMRQGLPDMQQPSQQQQPRRRRHRVGRQVREARDVALSSMSVVDRLTTWFTRYDDNLLPDTLIYIYISIYLFCIVLMCLHISYVSTYISCIDMP